MIGALSNVDLEKHGNGHGRNHRNKNNIIDSDDDSSESEYSMGSTGNVSSSGSDADTTSDGGSGENVKNIKFKQDSGLLWCKRIVATLLGLAIATSAFTTVTDVLNGGDVDFQLRFDEFASDIFESSYERMDRISEELVSTSLQITIGASSTSGTSGSNSWPFVTVPYYETQVEKVVDMSNASLIAFSPFVQTDNTNEKNKWQEYSGSSVLLDHQPIGPYYAPIWQVVTNYVGGDDQMIHNRDAFDVLPNFEEAYDTLLTITQGEDATATISNVLIEEYEDNVLPNDPHTLVAVPIYETVNDDASSSSSSSIAGILSALVPWSTYFRDVVPPSPYDEIQDIDAMMMGLILVVHDLENEQEYTYEINNPNDVKYLGIGDLHDERYTQFEVSTNFTGTTTSVASAARTVSTGPYTWSLYPSETFYFEFSVVTPFLDSGVVVFLFLIAGLSFLVYDCLVQRRHKEVLSLASKSDALVASLFPDNVRNRILNQDKKGGDVAFRSQFAPGVIGQNGTTEAIPHAAVAGIFDNKTNHHYLDDQSAPTAKPIADIFPESTVMFGDIAGFTAWSSIREPSQVFTLLESVYNAFDKIAKRLKVFKVETIGDCYVAAAGVPNPMKNHAIVMSRFASKCILKMREVVRQLEVTLGLDTADLQLRVGLHSGPVTAGVLRGDKSRFQLFGDTVNTASRIESTGVPDKIQLSQQTADLLIAFGKSHWVEPRETLVAAKGKGELQTYWLRPLTSVHSSYAASSVGDSIEDEDSVDDVQEAAPKPVFATDSSALKEEAQRRQVKWMVETLLPLLKKIVAVRGGDSSIDDKDGKWNKLEIETGKDQTVLDEVKEIITLPTEVTKYETDPSMIELDSEVVSQLTDYVTLIASMYRENSFHNFQHASHVTQSVVKLLSRVVTADSIDYDGMCYTEKAGRHQLHQFTFGITSDPLTQFAVAFSALIHDVDHMGVPNSQLVKEDADIAAMYRNQSVAEQNSVDIAWSLLQENRYSKLRACIYKDQSELERFRQLVVNTVMATDIVDKELGALRKKRWEKAFAKDSGDASSQSLSNQSQEDINRKATIVIEHMIQASDVAHTMQHWHVYLKWNERFFRECYSAYKAGRADKNPAEGWVQGELGFFDFYIIPLAKKLKECGVFGVASDEYLQYAVANRQEWEAKGKSVVEGYVSNYLSGKR